MSLTLYQSEKYFFIKSVNFIDQGEKTLVIDRPQRQIFEVRDDQLLMSVNKVTEGPIFGIVGIMNILGHDYLCVIKEAQDLGVLYGAHIYKITGVRILPFNIHVINPVGQYIEALEKYLCDGFYFSFGYDLTCSRQRRIKFLGEKVKDPLRVIASDHRYFWNLNLYNTFREQNVHCRWFTPLIQGYIGITHGVLAGKEIQIALLSRRQHLRGGTRFNARGLDDQGNAANFVETEQMIKMENTVISYVMIRGSVPIFWEQKGIIEDVTLSRGPEMTKRAFHKHFEEILNTYGPTYIVDLLSDTKKREIILTKEYVRQVYESDFKDQLKFLHFDFHHYCAGDKYQSLKVLVGKLGQPLQDFGYFMEDTAERKIKRFQEGVFRVNCLDSLDRTNVAQSKIAFMVFQKMLQKLGFDIARTFGEDVAKEGIAFAQIEKPLIHQYKHFWAEQGDYISKQYAGTTSTISKVSRDGKEGFYGKINHKLKNVQRFFINSLSENFSQNSIDIILGRHAKSIITSEMKSYMIGELKKREDLYTEVKNVKMFVGTWNLGGARPYESVDLTPWLFPFQKNFIPDILVLGFQEIVQLNTATVLTGKNQQSIKQWNDLILDNLKKQTGEDYVLVVSEDLVGCHLILVTKKGINHRLTDIATSKIKLGFSGKMGNKGATLIRFYYEDTSFCFINCHLESGMTLVDAKKRLAQVQEIFSTAFIKDRGTQSIDYQVQNHDVKVILGDLNYRINLPNAQCRRLIEVEDYEELIKHDEFQYAQQDSTILQQFKEGSLAFNPTYKYNQNSGEYDTSSKNRVPAWCDRILYDANFNLNQIYYGRAELRLSDHRPVIGLFEAKIRRVNEEAKLEIQEKIIQKYKTINPFNPDQQPKEKTPKKKAFSEKRRNSLSGSMVEPSIGDFGLVENIDNPHHSPKNPASIPLIIEDAKHLEEIVKSHGVHIDADEVKQHQTANYQEVLNQETVENDINIPIVQVGQLRFKRNEQIAQSVKQAGIFNEDSDEGDSPLKLINGKLKGLSPFGEQEGEQPKKALFSDDEEDDTIEDGIQNTETPGKDQPQ